jgi:hypothetical protein
LPTAIEIALQARATTSISRRKVGVDAAGALFLDQEAGQG